MALTTTVLLAAASLSGTVTTPTLTLPQRSPVPMIEIYGVLPSVTDAQDVTLVISRFAIQIQDSVSLVWRDAVAADWRGNMATDPDTGVGPGAPPHVRYSGSSIWGTVIRGIIVLPRAVTMGVSCRVTV
jgi:hypothetical protein